MRKQIPLVPEFAGKVKILHDELLEENEKVKKLSSQLEDPSNLKRFRELPGEETDEEALEAKI